MDTSEIIGIVLGSIGGVAVFIGLLFVIRWLLQGRRYNGPERLDGKVVIITGCNTGIGKAHALDMARRGARVYMACRDFQRCETARLDIVQQTGNQNVFNCTLDLGSLASVRAFVKKFLLDENQLHVLVNNAAVLPRERQTSKDGFEMQMGVNHLGPFLLTNLLLDVLRRSAPSRVLFVSSTGHYLGAIDRDDFNTERKAYGLLRNYNNSKLANVLCMRSLSQRLAGTGVTVNALHPGVVRTEADRDFTPLAKAMFSWIRFFFRTPDGGAQTQIRLSVDPALEEVTGKYFDNCREKRAATAALNDETAEWLWQRSAELTGL